jgi:hypothetical protein
MFSSRVFDEEVVFVRREVVHVAARDERISFSGTVELFVAEERGERRVALKSGIGLVGRVRIDSSENKVEFCSSRCRTSATVDCSGTFNFCDILSRDQILSLMSRAFERISCESMKGFLSRSVA